MGRKKGSLEDRINSIEDQDKVNERLITAMQFADENEIVWHPTTEKDSKRGIDYAKAYVHALERQGRVRQEGEENPSVTIYNAYQAPDLALLAHAANTTAPSNKRDLRRSQLPPELLNQLSLHEIAPLVTGVMKLAAPYKGKEKDFRIIDYEGHPLAENVGRVGARGIGLLRGHHKKETGEDPDFPFKSFEQDYHDLEERYFMRDKVENLEDPVDLSRAMFEAVRKGHEPIADLIADRAGEMEIDPDLVDYMGRKYGAEVARRFAPDIYESIQRERADAESQGSLF